ncbi:ergothioneine biosynthesis protein EgtB [Chitinimonas arctica]|uniref:Ergothioneine biosynthesis protein EgtB n=1 Tax=Chitinimonas arctica TaxID=2594795 RepID=A0A516SAL7_9NEIS|nr:ergothioneine biosynthesis protein EgtB [Chitinimonas arctica]QDQ25088.1 ergothioneine biosynthesis protein EgtB [Chitinimonas arctica]
MVGDAKLLFPLDEQPAHGLVRGAAIRGPAIQSFLAVRKRSEELAEGLSAEDCMVQSMPDASPIKWHLAHTSWFFETFVLAQAGADFRTFDPAYRMLFNSYYNGVGEMHPRSLRGVLSRPGLDEVRRYRAHIDQAIVALLERPCPPEWLALIELGINHEEQHQELILTDLKHHLWCNPLHPVYRAARPVAAHPAMDMQFCEYEGGKTRIGHAGDSFGFDNEQPAHTVWLQPFALGKRLVNNRDYLAFIEDGGYRQPEYWLSEGWERRRSENWQAPLYWQAPESAGQGWRIFTLSGDQPLRLDEPVCHLSYYEADAYARWCGARLPTEAEWEHAAQQAGTAREVFGGFMESGDFHPVPPPVTGAQPSQMFGEVWQWTASAYLPYPGFRTAAGAVGEYNGKFMINQMVLRGASCATPREHFRASYRNFFPPATRWQFAGLRLARDVLG